MSTKKVEFPFRDGLKTIQKGDKVIVSCMNKKTPQQYELTVTKIGRTLITLSNDTKWYIETGSQQSKFSSGNQIFSSIEALEEKRLVERKKREVLNFFVWVNGSKHTPDLINKVYELIQDHNEEKAS